MAISVMNWVWDHSRSRHGARLVLLAIADCLNEERPQAPAWPSVAELARKTNLKERAVRSAITELGELGELLVEYNAGPRGCNRYRICTPAKSAPLQSLQGAESAPLQDQQASESEQVNPQDPANFASPAKSAPLQKTTLTPAKSAPGTRRNQKDSSTKSLEGGAGGTTLFGDDTDGAQPSRRKNPRPDPGPQFDRWYAAYPVHKARGDAEKAWIEVTRAGADPEVLIAAAERYRSDPLVLRGFGKHPATWLRKKCWLDEPTAPQRPVASNGSSPAAYSDEEYANGW